MTSHFKKLLILLSAALLMGGAFLVVRFFVLQSEGVNNTSANTTAEEVLAPANTTQPHTTPAPAATPAVGTPPLPQTVLINVPFASQAPQGQWKDPRYQDACEEAAMLMAMAWVKNEELSPTKARDELAKFVQFEQDTYGNYHDTSAEDTAKLFKTYFHYDNIAYKTNISTEQIIEELANGNIVIAPFNGQKLKNPFFTAPGPERHMLVIIGYDTNKQEFVTNDPGLRTKGESYVYPFTIIEDALQDYPTGNHIPITTTYKNMIVVKPAP